MYCAKVALGLETETEKDRSITMPLTLYLFYGNRKILAFLNSGTEERLISQRFAVENRLKTTPVNRHNYAVNNYPITIYGSHNLFMQVIDNHNISKKSKRTFYATDMAHYNVILGREWLNDVNPDI